MKTKATDKEIIEHWYSLVPGQQFSSSEFYDHIEKEIEAQKVPSLTISRIDLAEGGVLSSKREYLRMQRERIRFDICAAPVGVNYFFSYRFYGLPAVVEPWEMIVFIIGLGALFDLSLRFVGLFLGPALALALLGFLVWLMRNAIGMGLRDVDATLLKIPVISSLYECYFRKDTYYRQDLRIAYGSIVSAIVKGEVESATAAKGVKLIREFLYSPSMGDLYSAKDRLPEAKKTAAPDP